ncbi:hypothetical protein [Xanthomonas arboricola]|uniref:hypothetical protein n=1 Tax=Xanthomonas arboricola TaxID=56448 RepID=UPI001622DE81|nr:hypothetical protein [Xanthomonas arboricola]MBB5858491.1 hypothetical protein [Xanthomonas arboricola]
MTTCFVIQPFDRGKFDKRFVDCFRPGIIDAGLEPYRVDGDPAAEVLISSIEDGIKNAAICLADITTDNANVWYELGFALALGKPVVMICADERQKFPFDIQHRSIIVYRTESTSDFDELRSRITMTLMARLSKAEMLKQAADSELVSEVSGISHPELVLVAAIASELNMPLDFTGLWSVKQSVERQGITSMGFQLALRRLMARSFVNLEKVDGDYEPYDGIRLTDRAWSWIEANDALFVTSKPRTDRARERALSQSLSLNDNINNFNDDDVPF